MGRISSLSQLSLLLIVALSSSSSVTACGGEHPPMNYQKRHAEDPNGHAHVARQATSTYPTGPAYDVPALASITPTPVTYTENILPVIQTYTPGSPAPLSGAPPLPTYTIIPTEWPDLSAIPPTNSPEVQGWLRELEGHSIPNIPVNAVVGCGNGTYAEILATNGPNGTCSWTCGGCTRESDITQCKDEWEWGHTYDDGPGFYTNKLLTYLNSLSPNGESEITGNVAPGIKATFFVVGARVISRPEIVVYEYMNNHEISIHTWSHSALTTLTNEQIVAELGWTRKAIRDVIGVTPLTFRPPYGDIDDRVRAIALAMGMRPVIWTGSMEGVPTDGSGSAIQWDSQDWRVHAGTVQPVPNQATFQSIMDSSAQFSNTSSSSYSPTMHGVVVLQHDIYVESVNLAIGYTLPYAVSHNPQFKLSTVTECQPRSDGSGKMSLRDAYVETNTDLGNPAWVALMSGNDNNGTVMSTSVIQSGGMTRTVTYALASGTSTSGDGNSNAAFSGKGVSGWWMGVFVGVFGGIFGGLML